MQILRLLIIVQGISLTIYLSIVAHPMSGNPFFLLEQVAHGGGGITPLVLVFLCAIVFLVYITNTQKYCQTIFCVQP